MSWSGLTAALGMLGLLLASAARLAYESYFRTLGLTLDEVGLSNARMLTWGAVLVLSFVGWAGSSAFAASWAWRAVRTHRSDRAELAGWLGAVLALGAHLLVLTLWTPWLYAMVALGVAALFIPFAVPGTWPRTRSSASVGAAAAYAVLGFLAIATVHRAPHAANELGADGSKGASFAAKVLDIAPRPVCVSYSHGGGAESRLLLGAADGMVVVFDAPQRRATRVPIGTITRIDNREPDGRC